MQGLQHRAGKVDHSRSFVADPGKENWVNERAWGLSAIAHVDQTVRNRIEEGQMNVLKKIKG